METKIKIDLASVSPLQLDLASGSNKREGFIGVDIVDIPEVDIVHNLEQYPWPFADNSVDAVHMQHYLEHVRDIPPFINELYRVMRVGAVCKITAPYYSSIRAWQDPDHVRVISEATPFYFNKGWREINKLEHYPITADFDFESVWGISHNWGKVWPDLSEEEKEFAVKHYLNVVDDIVITLVKRDPNALSEYK